MFLHAVAEAVAPRRSRRTEFLQRYFPYLLIAPALILLILVGVIPFSYAIYLSLHNTFFTEVESFAGISNFKDLVSDTKFWGALRVTTIITVVAVPIQLVLALGLALIFYRGVYAARVLSPVLLFPSVLAPIIIAIMWKIMLAGNWGILSFWIVERFNLVTGGIFGSPGPAIGTLIAIDVWQWVPFLTLAFYAGLQALPLAPFRAAAVDGASRWQVLRLLTIPMLYPLIAVLFLLRFIDTFKIFDSVFILTRGGPGDSTTTISFYLFRSVFEFWEIGRAAAAAVIVFVLFFILTSIVYRVFHKRLRLI